MSATIMAPLMNAAQHLLIKILLMTRFEPKLIALEARSPENLSQDATAEMPAPRTDRVSRRGRIALTM
jgi:hypothetical protein